MNKYIMNVPTNCHFGNEDAHLRCAFIWFVFIQLGGIVVGASSGVSIHNLCICMKLLTLFSLSLFIPFSWRTTHSPDCVNIYIDIFVQQLFLYSEAEEQQEKNRQREYLFTLSLSYYTFNKKTKQTDKDDDLNDEKNLATLFRTN